MSRDGGSTGPGADKPAAPEAAGEQLREQVNVEARQLLVSTAPRSPASSLLQQVDRLRAMRWLADEVSPKAETRLRWPAVVIAVVTAAILAYLLGSPASTVVVVDATTKSVEVELARIASKDEFAAVLGVLPVERLVANGSIRVVPSSAAVLADPHGTVVKAGAGKTLRLDRTFVTNVAPKGAPVLSIVSESAQRLRLCATGGRLSFDVVSTDPASPQTVQAFQIHVDAPAAGASSLAAASACAVIEIPRPAAHLQLLGNLPAAKLNVNGPAYRPAGTDDQADIFPSELKAAKVTFEEAPGTRQTVDEEQRLQLSDFNGQVRRVHWTKDQLRVQGSGLVTGVSRSIGATKQSMMPTRLTIWRAGHGDVWVAWGLLIYVLGIGLSLLKWFGVKV